MNKYFLLTLACLFILTSSCVNTEVGTEYPVSWTSQYTMASLLDDAIIIKEQNDLKNAINASWYAEVDIITDENESSEITPLSSCKDYFSKATSHTTTLREYETGPFLLLAKMCRATELLLHANPSKYSYISNNFLNKSTPHIFPSEIAFQISTGEAEKNAKDKSKHYWADINQNLQFEAISETQSKFFDDGGSQIIDLIGRGDFNADGIEDILISSRDSVEDGDYFNLRLFSLSVNEKREWRLIREYQY